MDRCERCKGPIERTEDDRFLCPACGIWVHLDGAELGPPITEKQALSNYERWTMETAAAMVEAAKTVDEARMLVPPSDERRKVSAISFDGIQLEHEDGWIYEYVAGKEPRRVRRSTSAKDPK